MQSIEAQKLEIKRRRLIYAEAKELKRKLVIEIVACAACLALMLGAAFVIPTLDRASGEVPVRQYGSMILSLPTVGYVVVALLSFVFGVAATLLCVHYRRRSKLVYGRVSGKEKTTDRVSDGEA